MNTLQDKCKEFKNLIQEKLELLKSNTIDKNHSYEIVINMQQNFIEYATFLEEVLKLYDTKVILTIQVSCELCYRYVVTHELDLKGFIYIMELQLHAVERWTFACVPESAYDLSIIAIIKNEMYIREWIEYHRMVGVSHFYIYDNESTNNMKEEIQDYIDSGIVTYQYFPGQLMQMQAYKHAVDNYSFETKYMAMIDGDEYIVPMQDALLPDIVDQIFEDYERLVLKEPGFAGGIGINWRDYGSSHHKDKQEGLCLENYMYRAPDDFFLNAHIKTIFIPRVVTGLWTPHIPDMQEGWRTISENGSTIPYSFFYDSMCKKLRINHYFCKSENEYREKIKRGWPDREHSYTQKRFEQEMEWVTNTCNQIYDPIMEKYIPELKRRLKGTCYD